MKTIKTSIICIALSGLTLASCIGSYATVTKVQNWNAQATDNKFLNTLIHIGLYIVPVYELSFVADFFIFNTIEFWTDSNPMMAGTVKEVQSENGKYLVTTTKDGYSIEKEGEENPIELKFNGEEQSWNVVSNGKTYEILKLREDGTVDMNLQNGQYLNVTPDAQGVKQAHDMIMSTTYYAAR